MTSFLAQKIAASQSYEAYRTMIDALYAESKTTGTNHSEEYLHHTKMNIHRMKRLDKTVVLNDELVAAAKAINTPYTWLTLTEAWCGDAAQNIPIVHQITTLNPNLELRLILRDEHLDLMDQHLTNGGRSIPKLIAINGEEEIVGSWGPRPAPVQKMVETYKAMENKPPYSEFSKEVQQWYNKDKTVTFQQEFLAFLKLHQ